MQLSLQCRRKAKIKKVCNLFATFGRNLCDAIIMLRGLQGFFYSFARVFSFFFSPLICQMSLLWWNCEFYLTFRFLSDTGGKVRGKIAIKTAGREAVLSIGLVLCFCDEISLIDSFFIYTLFKKNILIFYVVNFIRKIVCFYCGVFFVYLLFHSFARQSE